MFINHLSSVVSTPIFMFADDAKIFNVIRSHDDYVALQKGLDTLYNWSTTLQLKFNILKYKHFHLRSLHHHGPYFK